MPQILQKRGYNQTNTHHIISYYILLYLIISHHIILSELVSEWVWDDRRSTPYYISIHLFSATTLSDFSHFDVQIIEWYIHNHAMKVFKIFFLLFQQYSFYFYVDILITYAICYLGKNNWLLIIIYMSRLSNGQSIIIIIVPSHFTTTDETDWNVKFKNQLSIMILFGCIKKVITI